MFKKTGRGVSQLAPFFLLENVVYFEISTCKKPLFPDATAFFCVFEAHRFHHFSPFSSLTQLHFLSLLFSPLLSSSLLSSPPLSVVSVVSLFCAVVVFLLCVVLLRCCRCFCRRCSCCCSCFCCCRCSCCCCCCWWVLHVLERLFLVTFFN